MTLVKNNEQKAVLSLSLVMCARMLGLFLIFPVFSVYASHLAHATPALIGLTLGIYGFTQAGLQIPLGSLSDRIGRKPVITLGLLIFATGSVIAALSTSIYGIILGRALQGTGAIGSTILALLADLTQDENRAKAMATLGMSIGFSFMLAMVLGPALNHWVGLHGIFWAMFGLSLLSLFLVHTLLPTPTHLIVNPNTEYQANHFASVLKNKQLLRLNIGICITHALMTACFIGIPLVLTHILSLTSPHQIILYLILLPLAFLLMLPFIVVGETKRLLQPFMLGAASILVITQLLLAFFNTHLTFVLLALLLFFAAFTFFEATLPSLVSKIAPIERKGTAMGIYSTAQFFGIFAGGSLGGIIFTHFQLYGLFIFCTTLALLWLICALTAAAPPYVSTFTFKVSSHVFDTFATLHHTLNTTPGISDVLAMPKEQMLYIKADKKIINKEQLRKLIDEGTLGRHS